MLSGAGHGARDKFWAPSPAEVAPTPERDDVETNMRKSMVQHGTTHQVHPIQRSSGR